MGFQVGSRIDDVAMVANGDLLSSIALQLIHGFIKSKNTSSLEDYFRLWFDGVSSGQTLLNRFWIS